MFPDESLSAPVRSAIRRATGSPKTSGRWTVIQLTSRYAISLSAAGPRIARSRRRVRPLLRLHGTGAWGRSKRDETGSADLSRDGRGAARSIRTRSAASAELPTLVGVGPPWRVGVLVCLQQPRRIAALAAGTQHPSAHRPGIHARAAD